MLLLLLLLLLLLHMQEVATAYLEVPPQKTAAAGEHIPRLGQAAEEDAVDSEEL